MNLGIYVHIPFCVSKCLYCNFYSVTKLDLVNDYVLALVKEIKRESDKYKDYTIDTIFIGGGTPSVLPTGSISSIINTIKKHYKIAPNCEITIESNPNTISYTNALEWQNAGVNRVSVGLQSTSDRLLKKIGRAHTFNDFVLAIDNLKKVGFKNINADIMLGLPTQKQGDLRSTLKHCFRLGLTHLSAYTLILEEETPLYDLVKEGKLKLPSEGKTLNMFNYLLKQTGLCGYNRYEVSNFSLPNYECKHNLNCWNMCDYVGFGCASHSFVAGRRFANISNVQEYIANISSSKSVLEFEEQIEKNELIEETIMLGLRTTRGINLTFFKEKFNVDLLKSKQKQIENLTNLGLINIKDDYLFATTQGFYVLNQIIVDLVE